MVLAVLLDLVALVLLVFSSFFGGSRATVDTWVHAPEIEVHELAYLRE